MKSRAQNQGGMRNQLHLVEVTSTDITVESEPGRGSTFTIRLPKIVDAPKVVMVANPPHTGERH
jgi:hypothetical protein